jgi:hypothetical protein
MAHTTTTELPEDLRIRLEQVIAADYVPIWLETPIPLLGGKTPLETIADGGYGEVAALVASLEYQGAS